ncbi:ABC transporter permease [Bacillus cereus]|uniref:ABC transporter permease n=1 Tax=Bacillus cereus TaxID=1396 RepID=UPI000279CE01|nr:ABC transporter permease [Bacillus cereus]EJR73610.1 hypothetical protein IK9_05145 [Bacillus cereus VD166]MDZ4631655.1 ABC transporter permease [Bacillus cereus]
MNKVLNLAFNDFKYTVTSKGFLSAIATGLVFLGMWLVYRPQAFDVPAYQAELFKVLYMVLIYYCSKSLSGDFESGTYKTLFTSIYSRNQVLFSKLLMNLQIAVLIWILVQLLNPIIGFIINQKYGMEKFFSIDTLNSLLIFICIGFVIGSYTLLLTTITFSLLNTFITAFPTIWFFYFFTPLIFSVEEQLTGIWSIIKYIPFYTIGVGIFKESLSVGQLIQLFIWGIVFLITSIVIINRRDIKK